jgi:hypothetical protein
MELADQAPAIYIKRPVYDKGLLGFGKSYIDSEVLLDQTESFWRGRKWSSEEKHYLQEYDEKISAASKKTERPQRPEKDKQTSSTFDLNKYKEKSFETREKRYDSSFAQSPGYCIRTGVEIPFDPSSALSYSAYQNWAEFQNSDYPENFCHRTGRKSYGKTSVRNPIL